MADLVARKGLIMDVYEVLNRNISDKCNRISPCLFVQEDREKLNENDKLIFDILKKISSLGTIVSNSGIEFRPIFVMANGQRKFAIEDITDDDYKMLKTVDFQRLPLVLRSLLADIFWTQKKEFEAAKIAAEAYWEMFQLCHIDNDGLRTLDMIKRATCISVQTKQESLYSEICAWVNDYFTNGDIRGNVFWNLEIIELFVEQKGFDVSLFLPVLDGIISIDKDNVRKVEQAYEVKTKCLHKLRRKEDATKNNLSLAEYYVNFAEKTVQRDTRNVIGAVALFHKAIVLYQNNGESLQAERIHKRLVEVQEKIPQLMVPICTKLNIQSIVDNIELNMRGLTFEESVIRLTQMVCFDSKEEIRSRVIDKLEKFPLSYLFGRKRINKHGQIVFALPPLDIKNPEKNPRLLELHMYQNELEKQKIIGDTLLKNALAVIRNDFLIKSSMLDFLVKENPIIPKGREKVFENAICMFLKGEFYESIHILAPQTENLFRNIAKEVGGLTVTLENDGTSMEKVLRSIFNLPELLESYDNDILFVFKGLLNEQAGANIRNEVAHGIIDESTCSSGACLYFGVAVIKLLSFTSKSCYEILKNSEKLKRFEEPEEDAFRIID